LLGSAIPASSSNPALRILLRAFSLARDALQRIAPVLGFTLSRWERGMIVALRATSTS